MTPEERRKTIAEAEALLTTVANDETTTPPTKAALATVAAIVHGPDTNQPSLWDTMHAVAAIMKGKIN